MQEKVRTESVCPECPLILRRVTGKMAHSTNPGTSNTAVSVALADRGGLTLPSVPQALLAGVVTDQITANDRAWRAS